MFLWQYNLFQLTNFCCHRINHNVIYAWQYTLSPRCWPWPYNMLQQCQSVATKYYCNAYLRGNTWCCHDIGCCNNSLMQCFIAWQLQVLQHDKKNRCNAAIASKVIATARNKTFVVAMYTYCNYIRPIATFFALLP